MSEGQGLPQHLANLDRCQGPLCLDGNGGIRIKLALYLCHLCWDRQGPIFVILLVGGINVQILSAPTLNKNKISF